MNGIFSSAWSSNWATVVRVVGGVSIAQGYADYGDLTGVTDSTPQIIGETDNYVACVSGVNFVDNPSGATPVLTPVYACVRREVIPEYGGGAKAYFYIDGFTPNPAVWYPSGSSVPGALSFRLRAWASLPGDYMVASDASYIYVGNPFVATKRATIDGMGVIGNPKVYAFGYLPNGTVVAAGIGQYITDSSPAVFVSLPFDVGSEFPASVEVAMTNYGYTPGNPWKAALAAIGVTYGSSINKAQTGVRSGKLAAWSSVLLVPTTTSEGQLYSMDDAVFLMAADAGSAPEKVIKNGTMSYSVTGGTLTFSGSATAVYSTPATNLASFNVAAPAKSVYADSNLWEPPPVPPFWNSFVRTRES